MSNLHVHAGAFTASKIIGFFLLSFLGNDLEQITYPAGDKTKYYYDAIMHGATLHKLATVERWGAIGEMGTGTAVPT